MVKRILLFFLSVQGLICFPQDSLTNKSLLIKNDDKVRDLAKLEKYEIYQQGASRGKDSIDAVYLAYSINRQNDTLLIRPKKLSINRLFDTTYNAYERKFYERDSSPIVKIPIGQIKIIKAKKQPIAKILSTVVVVSYVSFVGSIFISVSNPKYSVTGIVPITISLGVLSTSWPAYFIWAKKRYWLDSKKKRKNWTFS